MSQPAGAQRVSTSTIESQVLRRLTLRIVPFVIALYFVSFLNRVNVGFAALTMNVSIRATTRLSAWALS